MHSFSLYHSIIIIITTTNIYSKDGTKVTTRIKQVSGDRQVFLQELQALLPSQSIRVRTGGTIEVNGNYARPIRQWLAGLGF